MTFYVRRANLLILSTSLWMIALPLGTFASFRGGSSLTMGSIVVEAEEGSKGQTIKKNPENEELEDTDLLAPQTTTASSGSSSNSRSTNTNNNKAHRLLEEEVPCVEFDSLSVITANHELSEATCLENICDGGCCRSYFWLFCDRSNAFPEIPCICNEQTQDPQEFDAAGDNAHNDADAEEHAVGGGNEDDGDADADPTSTFTAMPSSIATSDAGTSDPTTSIVTTIMPSAFATADGTSGATSTSTSTTTTTSSSSLPAVDDIYTWNETTAISGNATSINYDDGDEGDDMEAEDLFVFEDEPFNSTSAFEALAALEYPGATLDNNSTTNVTNATLATTTTTTWNNNTTTANENENATLATTLNNSNITNASLATTALNNNTEDANATLIMTTLNNNTTDDTNVTLIMTTTLNNNTDDANATLMMTTTLHNNNSTDANVTLMIPNNTTTLAPTQTPTTLAPTFVPLTSHPPTPHPTISMVPTLHPTVSPDACRDGSPLENFSGFSEYTVCETSFDCLGLGPATTTTVSRVNNNNNNGGGNTRGRRRQRRSLLEKRQDNDKRSLKGGKGKDNTEESEDAEDEEQGEQQVIISAAQEEQQTSFCCLSSMCMCGSPPGGDWHQHCVPPYSILNIPPPSLAPTKIPSSSSAPAPTVGEAAPTTTTAEELPDVMVAETRPPTFAPTLAPTDRATTTTSGDAAAVPTVHPVVAESNTTEAAEPPTVCSEGSWYHDDPRFVDWEESICVWNSECQQKNEAHCCLRNFCFCGAPQDGDMSYCV